MTRYQTLGELCELEKFMFKNFPIQKWMAIYIAIVPIVYSEN